MTITLSGGFAYFTIIILFLFTAYWLVAMWTLIVGGTADLSFSSKGAIPQIKAFIHERRKQKAQLAELRAKFDTEIQEIEQQNPSIKISVKKFKEVKK